MTKVTAPVLCSRKWCKRETVKGLKQCQRCRDMAKKSRRKRREKVAKRTAKEGYRICAHCYSEQSESQYLSCHSRRQSLTTWCATCRASLSKSEQNETTKKGKCRKVWLDWRDSHSCQECSYTGQCIEADHPSGDKVRACSDYPWWARNGGPEAVRRELAKCRPLCTFCHRLWSQEVHGVDQRPCMVKKRTYVNKFKRDISKCEICERKIQGEMECCCFDLDHRAQSKKRDNISEMVRRYSLKKFFSCIDEELSKVRLLCCICHRIHSKDQTEKNRAEHMIFFVE